MRLSVILVAALACAVCIEARQLKWDPYAEVKSKAVVKDDADAVGDGKAGSGYHHAYATHDSSAASKYDGYGEGKVLSVGKSGDGEAGAASGGYSKTYGPAKAATWGGSYADEDLSAAETKAASLSVYDGYSETYAKSAAVGEEGKAVGESKTATYGPAAAKTDGTAVAKDDFAASKSSAASKSAYDGESDAESKFTTDGDAGKTLSHSKTATEGPAAATSKGAGVVKDGKAAAVASSSASSKDGGKAYTSQVSAAKADK